MNVPHKNAKAVASGRATQVRLPIVPGRIITVGKEQPVQPLLDRSHPDRSRAAMCRVTITDAQGQRLGDVTHAEARAMDCKTVAEFKEQWIREHDAKWAQSAGDALGVLEGAAVEARFCERWADVVVWAITVELVSDRPRFLAVPGRGDVGTDGNADYTYQRARAIDDLEVVDETWTRRFAKEADAFCRGRQLERQREMNAKQAAKKAERRPWAKAA